MKLAMTVGLATLVGFDSVANLAKEARESDRTVPRALVGGGGGRRVNASWRREQLHQRKVAAFVSGYDGTRTRRADFRRVAALDHVGVGNHVAARRDEEARSSADAAICRRGLATTVGGEAAGE